MNFVGGDSLAAESRARGRASRVLCATRPYRNSSELDYSVHDNTATATHYGLFCFNGRKVNLGGVFVWQYIGIKEVSDRIWLANFMQYDLGYFDHETCSLESVDNPFQAKVLPMSPV